MSALSELIKSFSNGSRLEFDQGGFDAWCVYFVRPDGSRTAPKDIDYFRQLQQLGDHWGRERLYADFVRIYDSTTASLDRPVLDLIGELSAAYGRDALRLEILLTTVYAGMLAEENKRHAVLKKRVKRLGMYQVLMEQATPEFAAGFSRNRKAVDIAVDCRERGF